MYFNLCVGLRLNFKLEDYQVIWFLESAWSVDSTMYFNVSIYAKSELPSRFWNCFPHGARQYQTGIIHLGTYLSCHSFVIRYMWLLPCMITSLIILPYTANSCSHNVIFLGTHYSFSFSETAISCNFMHTSLLVLYFRSSKLFQMRKFDEFSLYIMVTYKWCITQFRYLIIADL